MLAGVLTLLLIIFVLATLYFWQMYEISKFKDIFVIQVQEKKVIKQPTEKKDFNKLVDEYGEVLKDAETDKLKMVGKNINESINRKNINESINRKNIGEFTNRNTNDDSDDVNNFYESMEEVLKETRQKVIDEKEEIKHEVNEIQQQQRKQFLDGFDGKTYSQYLKFCKDNDKKPIQLETFAKLISDH